MSQMTFPHLLLRKHKEKEENQADFIFSVNAQLEQAVEAITQLQQTVSHLTERIGVLEKENTRIITLEQTVKQLTQRVEGFERKPHEHQHDLNEKPRTRADTPFRAQMKKIIEENFGIQEFERKQVDVVSRKTREKISTAINGVVYGDGGPYIECERTDLIRDNLHQKQIGGPEGGFYFDLYTTKDNSVVVYDQKRDVKNARNPPANAKYQDLRYRTDGYADYKPGKVYISPDEIFLLDNKEEQRPKEDKKIGEFLENDLTPEQKQKDRTLVFSNCSFGNENDLLKFLVENRVIEKGKFNVLSAEKIGRRIVGREQSLKIEFSTKEEVDHIFQNRKKLFGVSKMFINKFLSPEELRDQRKMREQRREQESKRPQSRPNPTTTTSLPNQIRPVPTTTFTPPPDFMNTFQQFLQFQRLQHHFQQQQPPFYPHEPQYRQGLWTSSKISAINGNGSSSRSRRGSMGR
jgi:hypothetical protein